MTFKDIINYTDSENVGTIYLYGNIGDIKDEAGNVTPGINGAMFAAGLDYLQASYPRINVRINSTGGSVIEGYAIFNSIRTCKVPIDIYIDGMCASMAGVIAMAGDCIYMNDYALLMLHNPNGGADQTLLDILKETLVMIYSKRTGKTPEQIDQMMNKTTWLTADEAKTEGLIDIIIETEQKDKEEIKKQMNKYEMKNSSDLCHIYNSILDKKINTTMDKKEEALSLIDKLKAVFNKKEEDRFHNKEEDEDDRFHNAEEMNSLKNEIKNLKKMNKDMSDALDAYNKKEKEGKEKEVKDLVDSYVSSNTIKQEEVESITNLLNLDFTATKSLIERNKIKVGEPTRIAASVVNSLNVEDNSTWTLKDWMKKDKKGLNAMMINDKVSFDLLVEKSNSQFKD